MLVKHYRDLWVYQRAFKAAMRIFELSKSWPGEERYSLTDQIRRSSRSVCGAIAEAWRKRRYEAHFVSKLSDADSEAAETQNWLAFAKQCGYLVEVEFDFLDNEYNAISGGLVNMMDSPSQWCGISNAVHENSEEYGMKEQTSEASHPHIHTPPHPHSHTSKLPHSSSILPNAAAAPQLTAALRSND